MNRSRLPHFLNAADLEQVRAIQNDVIVRLPRPPRNHWIYGEDARTIEWYEARFVPMRQPYSPGYDIWLRYHSPEDVRPWAEFVLSVLPKAVDQASWMRFPPD
jgi:hypothetical protein